MPGGRRRRPAERSGLDRRRLAPVLRHIDAHPGDDLSLAALSAMAGLSAHHFASAFRSATGVSPHRYVTARRIARACELLAGADASVTEIAHALGFASHGHFSEMFRRHVGLTPTAYRARAPRGE